jgi:hypothetical protein
MVGQTTLKLFHLFAAVQFTFGLCHFYFNLVIPAWASILHDEFAGFLTFWCNVSDQLCPITTHTSSHSQITINVSDIILVLSVTP